MIIEGDYEDVTPAIYLDVKNDYVNNPFMTVREIKTKYGLYNKKWMRVRDRIIEETGFTRKNRGNNRGKNNCYGNGGKYHIQKYVDGSLVNFGTYKNRKDAEKVASKLNEYGWDKNQLNRILEETGVERCNASRMTPRNYTKHRDKFMVTKSSNNKINYYGLYESEDIAKKVVEMLKEVDWDKSELPRIREELEV